MRPLLRPLGSAHADRRESGVATLEFALAAVLLLTLVSGIVFYGMLLAVKHTVTQAAAEGARAAVPAATVAAAPGLATPQASKSTGWLGTSCGSVELTCNATTNLCDPAVPNVYCITVTVTYYSNKSSLLPKLPFVPPPPPISSTSVVRINPSS